MCRKTIGGVELAWGRIENDGRNRRLRESEVVDKLVKLLYGTEAVKKNSTDGAPHIYIGDNEAEFCSISHCATLAIVAKAPFVTGIDIETEREQLQRVASRFVNKGDESLGLLKVWTLKEAIYKAAGRRGLGLKEIYLLPSPCLDDGTKFAVIFSDYISEGVFMSLVKHR